MKRTFCDKCKQEINGKYFKMLLYVLNTEEKELGDEEDIDIDLCGFCKKDFDTFFKEIKVD